MFEHAERAYIVLHVMYCALEQRESLSHSSMDCMSALHLKEELHILMLYKTDNSAAKI